MIDLEIQYLTVTGSQAYSLATKDSDCDFKGFGLPENKYLFGFLSRFEQTEDKEDICRAVPKLLEAPGARNGIEGTIYSLPKFLKLALEGNPNLLEMLGTNEEHLIVFSDAGKFLREHLSLFLSQKVRHSFLGYAIDQLHRIKSSREHETGKWAHLVAKYGYNTKHAMHLVRLLRMGYELLSEGKLIVNRRGIDADELLAIRDGAWPYDKVEIYTDYMKKKIIDFSESGKSPLPRVPKSKWVEDWYIDQVTEKRQYDYFIRHCTLYKEPK